MSSSKKHKQQKICKCCSKWLSKSDSSLYRRGYCSLECEASHKRLNHIRSVVTYNSIRLALSYDWSLDHKTDYICRVLLPHAHPDDQYQLRERIDKRLQPLKSQIIEQPPVEAPEPIPAPELPATHGKLHVHIIRAANELGMLPQVQLWHILRKLDSGRGCVGLEDALAQVVEYGFSRSKFYAVLSDSDGFWWTYDRANRRIFLSGQGTISKRLARELPEDRLQHYAGQNAIGSLPIWGDLTGTKAQFLATTFAAFIELRSKREQLVTIANETIATLFGVSARTVQRWKAALGERIGKLANYTQQAPRQDGEDYQIHPDTPDHAIEIHTRQGKGYLWQLPNSYAAPEDIKKHTHRGRTRKARAAFDAEIAQRIPGFKSAAGKSARRYFVLDDVIAAFPKVDKYLRKPDADSFLPRHILLKSRTCVQVWETFQAPMQLTHVGGVA